MKIEFSTRDYEQSHGAKPRGRGSWAFCPIAHWDQGNYLDHCFWAPAGLTYGEAKKRAKEYFQAHLGLIEQDPTIIVCT